MTDFEIPDAPSAPAEEPKPADWENELTPERARLKETADLLTSVLQTVTLVERPHDTLAGYAAEFLKLHEAELPASEVEDIKRKATALMESKPVQH